MNHHSEVWCWDKQLARLQISSASDSDVDIFLESRDILFDVSQPFSTWFLVTFSGISWFFFFRLGKHSSNSICNSRKALNVLYPCGRDFFRLFTSLSDDDSSKAPELHLLSEHPVWTGHLWNIHLLLLFRDHSLHHCRFRYCTHECQSDSRDVSVDLHTQAWIELYWGLF